MKTEAGKDMMKTIQDMKEFTKEIESIKKMHTEIKLEVKKGKPQK